MAYAGRTAVYTRPSGFRDMTSSVIPVFPKYIRPPTRPFISIGWKVYANLSPDEAHFLSLLMPPLAVTIASVSRCPKHSP